MSIFDAIFGGQPPISEQHMAMRSMRLAIQTHLSQVFSEYDAIGRAAANVPDAPDTQVLGVCQYPERECETIYVLGGTGNVMRIRIDGAPQEKAEEFMAGEPAIEYRAVKVPNDPGDLLKGDMGL